MRSRFPGYYPPTDEQFAELWKTALVVPDTNILLHLFRYGEQTRAQILNTLTKLQPRVWIPYYVGLEFQKHWREVDERNRGAYADLIPKIEAAQSTLKSIFEDYTRHQVIDVVSEQNNIDKFFSEFCARIRKMETNHPSLENAHKIFNQISDLIGESVGDKFPDSKLSEIHKEGETRYAKKLPPGYRDSGKTSNDEKFSDLAIWNSILEKAKSDHVSVIFITDDQKDDWWLSKNGKKIGPRPELIEEFREKTSASFYMYNLSRFLEYSSKYLDSNVDPDAIKEVKADEDLSRKNELQAGALDIARSLAVTERRKIDEEIVDLMDSIRNYEKLTESTRFKSMPPEEKKYHIREFLRLHRRRSELWRRRDSLITSFEIPIEPNDSAQSSPIGYTSREKLHRAIRRLNVEEEEEGWDRDAWGASIPPDDQSKF